MDISSKKYLMFLNEKKSCWLDSSLALILYNKTVRESVAEFPESEINHIIAKHEEAIAILNDPDDNNIEDKLQTTRSILLEIQQSTLQYLQHFSNFKKGEPDSAFCALLNLILQDKSNIKEQLCASWLWIKQCTSCGNSSKFDSPIKPIITLPKVENFQPESPVSFYKCSCKAEQEMKLLYKLLPSCLIFHFENGAGDGETYPLLFTVEERNYHLSAVIVLEKSSDPKLNHFVTYIRDPSSNSWLDCNDLNTTFVSFSPKQPEFALKDVCIFVFEAFDNLGKISIEVSVDNDENLENMHVECIDLVNEAEMKLSLENVDEKDNSSILYPSVKKEEFLLNPKNLGENTELEEKTTSKINLPLKEDIKESQLNTNSNVIPVISKESDKLDINSSSNIQKVEAKNLLDSVFHAGKSYEIKENIDKPAENSNSDAITELKNEHSDFISSKIKNESSEVDLSRHATAGELGSVMPSFIKSVIFEGSIDKSTNPTQTPPGKGGLFNLDLKNVHGEKNNPSSEVDMSSYAAAEKISNMLCQMAIKSVIGESEQLLKDKKVENMDITVAADLTLDLKNVHDEKKNPSTEVDMSSYAAAEKISNMMECNACGSTETSTKPKKGKKTKKPEKVPPSRAPVRKKRRTTDETDDSDEVVDAKVRELVDEVVPRTVAAFMEQLLLRHDPPL